MADQYVGGVSLPDASQYQSDLPFGMRMPTVLGMQAAANQRETAAPFLQRQGEREDLGLQEQRQKTKEFLSSPFVQQRRTAEEAKTAESQYKIQDFAAQTARLPLKDRNERADMAGHYAQSLDVPQQQMFMHMASQAEAVEKAAKAGDFDTVEKIKQDTAKRFITMYPDKQDLAQRIATARPDHFIMAHNFAVNSAQHMQDMEKEKMKEQEAMKRTQEVQRGETLRERERNEATRTAEMTASKAMANLRKLPPNHPDRDSYLQQTDQAHDQIAESEAEKRFGKLDAISMTMLRIEAASRAKQLGMDQEQTDAAVKSSVDDFMTRRQQYKDQLMYQRGVSMAYLRRKFPGVADERIRNDAKSRGVRILE